VRSLQKQEKRRLEVVPKKSEAKAVRFSPKWTKANGQRLGFSAKNYSASNATLRIWIDGSLIYEYADKALENDQF